jgi:crotonobetainyl-CoA:carnitine CoA-transferase CaiB-like acyl-CoA transferase
MTNAEERYQVAVAARLGEHTRALLEAAGLSAEQIAAMLGSGAAVASSFSKTAGVSRS